MWGVAPWHGMPFLGELVLIRFKLQVFRFCHYRSQSNWLERSLQGDLLLHIEEISSTRTRSGRRIYSIFVFCYCVSFHSTDTI